MPKNTPTQDEQDQLADIPHERKEDRPDFSRPLPRRSLPPELQKTLDNEERLWDVLYEGKGEDSTNSSVRYAAYASRLRTILVSAQRYVAYTSDIGESFRPIAHPNWVRAAYGVSWAYLAGDVAHEGYKSYLHNQAVRNPPPPASGTNTDLVLPPGKVPAIDDYRTRMAERAVFQSVASMGLPAFTIHSVVRYSGRALKNVKQPRIRAWGPIGLGLAVVPALPFLFDRPVEAATEWAFHTAFETLGGPAAVGKDPTTGGSARDVASEKEL